MAPIGIFCARQKAKPENDNGRGKYRQRTIGQRLTRPENDIKHSGKTQQTRLNKQDSTLLAGKRDIRLDVPFSFYALVMMMVVMVMMVVVMPSMMMMMMVVVTELDRNLSQSGRPRSLRLSHPRIVRLQ
jgi:hypothetical protein